MCVLYVSFASKVRPRTFGCVTMGSAVLFFCPDCSLIVLSGFSVRLFCFVQEFFLCMYGCMYFLAALVIVDVMVMSSA